MIQVEDVEAGSRRSTESGSQGGCMVTEVQEVSDGQDRS